jgi:hypothetical protein
MLPLFGGVLSAMSGDRGFDMGDRDEVSSARVGASRLAWTRVAEWL